MSQPIVVPVIVVSMAVFIAAIIDIWKYKVHNLLTVPLFLSGVAYHCVVAGGAGLMDSLLGALFGMGVLIVFYAMGGVGAGDVKLLAAVGAWLKFPLTFWVFIASSLAAGIYAMILVAYSGRTHETWTNLRIVWYRLLAVGRHLGAEDQIEVEVNRDDRRMRVIPYAAMIAVGMASLVGAGLILGKP